MGQGSSSAETRVAILIRQVTGLCASCGKWRHTKDVGHGAVCPRCGATLVAQLEVDNT